MIERCNQVLKDNGIDQEFSNVYQLIDKEMIILSKDKICLDWILRQFYADFDKSGRTVCGLMYDLLFDSFDIDNDLVPYYHALKNIGDISFMLSILDLRRWNKKNDEMEKIIINNHLEDMIKYDIYIDWVLVSTHLTETHIEFFLDLMEFTYPKSEQKLHALFNNDNLTLSQCKRAINIMKASSNVYLRYLENPNMTYQFIIDNYNESELLLKMEVSSVYKNRLINVLNRFSIKEQLSLLNIFTFLSLSDLNSSPLDVSIGILT